MERIERRADPARQEARDRAGKAGIGRRAPPQGVEETDERRRRQKRDQRHTKGSVMADDPRRPGRRWRRNGFGEHAEGQDKRGKEKRLEPGLDLGAGRRKAQNEAETGYAERQRRREFEPKPRRGELCAKVGPEMNGD